MEGYFSYNIGGKDIHFFIGVYSLEKTLEEMDASLSDLEMLLNKKFMQVIRLYMFYSAQYQALKTGQDFPYTQFDVHNWIDQAGGTEGEFYVRFTKAFMKAMGLNMDEPEEPKKEQKKSPRVKPIK